jgi:hypothetical protein
MKQWFFRPFPACFISDKLRNQLETARNMEAVFQIGNSSYRNCQCPHVSTHRNRTGTKPSVTGKIREIHGIQPGIQQYRRGNTQDPHCIHLEAHQQYIVSAECLSHKLSLDHSIETQKYLDTYARDSKRPFSFSFLRYCNKYQKYLNNSLQVSKWLSQPFRSPTVVSIEIILTTKYKYQKPLFSLPSTTLLSIKNTLTSSYTSQKYTFQSFSYTTNLLNV